MANSVKKLQKANKEKYGEFYTRLSDIENELRYYTRHLKGKTVLCNCDDPRVSNFFRYFALNFRVLGLKRLIATCYKNDNPDLFSEGIVDKSIYSDYNGGFPCNALTDFCRIPYEELNGDGVYSAGDFRSKDCINLLKQADVVVTNPPFSLFREYVAQLIKYNKQFLIIGEKNAITYKEIFPLIKDNKIWLGQSVHSGEVLFYVTDEYYKEHKSVCKIDSDGRKCKGIGVRWFTNLDVASRHEEIILYKSYNPDDYPKYDNYDAINVDKVSDIPCDYDGVMGVPITFLDKYNPEQFEIVEFRKGNDGKDLIFSTNGGGYGSLISEYSSVDADRRIDEQSQRYNREWQEQIRTNSYSTTRIPGMIKSDEGVIGGRITYARILIRRLKHKRK